MDAHVFLQDLTSIYSGARESEDGQRCMVAPSPDLRERIKSAVRTLAMREEVPSALSLRASEPRRLGFNDGVIIPPNTFPLDTAASVMRAAPRPGGPLRGTVRVIVVLVDFADKPMTQTQRHYQDLFFSTGVIPTKSVREYYHEVTNGLVDIIGDVVGPFRMPQSITSYAHGQSGTGVVLPNAQTMAFDAARAADPTIDYTPYDNDGNGFVDAFIVIHAGAGGEVTGDSNDIWSHKWTLDGGALAVDRTKLFAYLTVPEDCKVGVCAHELGHLLFGFPDLYDIDYSSEGIGDWCLMAGGSWGGGGDTPAHPCAWCKANQGWVTVNNVMRDGPTQISDVKASHTVHRLWNAGRPGNEYFLLENRQQTGFDASLPASGLLIWHVDEAQATNADERHYKVALMQADGRRDLEGNANRGDAGDPFPGSSGNTVLDGRSTPSSLSYAGAPTGVAVTNISASGPVMTADISVGVPIVASKGRTNVPKRQSGGVRSERHVASARSRGRRSAPDAEPG